MIISLSKLDFYQAFRYNSLLFILLFVGIIYLIIMVIIFIKKKVIIIPSTKSLIILLIILIGYMILRNISYFPYLIPTKI